MALYLGTVRHVYSAIEKPVSSMLKWIPHFTHLRRLLDRCSTPSAEWEHSSLSCPELYCFSRSCAIAHAYELSRMGLYGSRTPKPSYLMGVGLSSQQ